MTIVSLFLVLMVCDPLSDFFKQPQAIVALEKKKKCLWELRNMPSDQNNLNLNVIF